MRPMILVIAAALAAACDRGGRASDTTGVVPDSVSSVAPTSVAGTQLAAQSALLVVIEAGESGNAPAELLLTDPSGRRTGRDPRVGFAMNEIAGASYDAVPASSADPSSPSAALANQLSVAAPTEGVYEILVVGTRAGSYTLGIQLSMPDGGRRATALQGLATGPNLARRFRFSYARSDTGAIVLAP